MIRRVRGHWKAIDWNNERRHALVWPPTARTRLADLIDALGVTVHNSMALVLYSVIELLNTEKIVRIEGVPVDYLRQVFLPTFVQRFFGGPKHMMSSMDNSSGFPAEASFRAAPALGRWQ